ncbi:MAG: hypothetical protein OXL68_07095, partial [Paracoccaceae bacterium]|nr:hypothetical protein [Paracoccaceae bacterium]
MRRSFGTVAGGLLKHVLQSAPALLLTAAGFLLTEVFRFGKCLLCRAGPFEPGYPHAGGGFQGLAQRLRIVCDQLGIVPCTADLDVEALLCGQFRVFFKHVNQPVLEGDDPVPLGSVDLLAGLALQEALVGGDAQVGDAAARGEVVDGDVG